MLQSLSSVSAADSRPAAAEHQFVCRGNKRKRASLSPACTSWCRRAGLQCILNILPVVQRSSAVACLTLPLASGNGCCGASARNRRWSRLFSARFLGYRVKRSNKLLKKFNWALFLIELSWLLVTLFILLYYTALTPCCFIDYIKSCKEIKKKLWRISLAQNILNIKMREITFVLLI